MASPGPALKTSERPRATLPREGYECEFVQRPPEHLQDQVECAICQLVLRSPHLTSCCGHNFCKECVEFIQKNRKSCPLCNTAGFTVLYNRAHDQSLKQLQVYCTHRKVGCKWQGKLEKLDNHLNVDPEGEKQLEGCGFVEVQCCHDGCGRSLQRRDIAKHQSQECPQRPFTCELCKLKSTYDDVMNKHKREECPKRPFTCEYCHKYKSTYHDVTTNHRKKCLSCPILCPNECTQTKIERCHMPKHLDEECPLQELECELKYAGCETKPLRKEMPKHLSEIDHHTHLLARQNQELMAKIQEKEETIKRIKEKNHREMAKLNRLIQSQHERQKEVEEQVSQLEVGNVAVKDNTVTRAKHEKVAQQWVTKRELDEHVEELERKQRDKRKEETETRLRHLAREQQTIKANLERRMRILGNKMQTEMQSSIRNRFQQMENKRDEQVSVMHREKIRKLAVAVCVPFLAVIVLCIIFSSSFALLNFLLLLVMFFCLGYC